VTHYTTIIIMSLGSKINYKSNVILEVHNMNLYIVAIIACFLVLEHDQFIVMLFQKAQERVVILF